MQITSSPIVIFNGMTKLSLMLQIQDPYYRLVEYRDWIIDLEGWIAHGCTDLGKEKEQMSLNNRKHVIYKSKTEYLLN